jgi:hypothetical protein
MQRLSMIASTAFVVLALSGAAFMKKPAASTPSPVSPAVASANAAPAALSPTPTPLSPVSKPLVNFYYWYSAIDGSYNDWETLSYEIWEMEIYYGVTVNTNPIGGTLIEKGFTMNNPNLPVNEFLYGHF